MQTLVLALGAGVLIQILARKLRLPAIAPLLLAGVVLGPEALGLVRPTALGPALEPLVVLAVAVVLFEAGLTLDVRVHQAVPVAVRRLVTVGVVVTWLGAAAVGHELLGLSLPLALLAGSLLVVTGPTVVNPILRHTRVQARLNRILQWEAVLIDPIGIFLALLCFEWMIPTAQDGLPPIAGFALRVLVGAAVGLAGAMTLHKLLEWRWVPPDYTNAVVLGGALLLYLLADAVLAHAGVMAVALCGFLFAQWHHETWDIKAFEVLMADVAVGFIFILLAADLDVAALAAFGWRGLAALALIVFVLRPVAVALCTWRLQLSWGEKALMAWVAPRGVVAASMAALFAAQARAAGYPGAAVLEPLTFAVVAGTVLLQGFTAGPMARWLGVTEPPRHGWAIVGAHNLGRRLAHLFRLGGIHAVVIDRHAPRIDTAKAEGLPAFRTDALSATLMDTEVMQHVGHVLALTRSEALNQRIVHRWLHDLRSGRSVTLSQLCYPYAQGLLERPARRVEPLSEVGEAQTQLAFGELALRLAWFGTGSAKGLRPLLVLRAQHVRPIVAGRPRRGELIIGISRPELPAERLFKAVLHTDAAELSTAAYPELNADRLMVQLMQRERTMPMFSSLGNQVVVPHVFTPAVQSPLCAVGLLRRPVYDINGAAVRGVFLLLSPPDRPRPHVEALAKIARFAASKTNVDTLLRTTCPTEALMLLHERASQLTLRGAAGQSTKVGPEIANPEGRREEG